MVIALGSFVVLAVLAVGTWEILSGLIDIVVGLFLMVTGALLYLLSFIIEGFVRAARCIWRCI